MSQRDDLIAGAKKCLVEKGYSRTTARDIAAASGAHLASIGYHFGSKDALMNLAALQMQDEWGEMIAEVVRSAEADGPPHRLRIALDELLAALPRQRELIVAATQAYAQVEFADDIRGTMTEASREARRELAALVLGIDPARAGADTARATGSVVYALVVGFAVQSLLDPDSLPTGAQAADALRTLAGRSGGGA
ncbi:TetR/AcrR family transcriptional regulator [Allonocardiopsis opalescens]|uniref:TetR family transcriptional regulator n=1 Tax=Allonocardiopsis opalescens TaxID=1144618 RepID=A0A2T0QD74_9ACTN|nr:TetR family transcriptional regulator [Allonocardiopsis opalescens]PRY01820.1 TetR family transcriptional regulator [Allonocardiopsis opalescens]